MTDREREFWLIVYRSLMAVVKALARYLEIEKRV